MERSVTHGGFDKIHGHHLHNRRHQHNVEDIYEGKRCAASITVKSELASPHIIII